MLAQESRSADVLDVVDNPAEIDSRREGYKCIFFLTWDCNLRCRYCYEKTKESKRMSLEVAIQAVDYFMNYAKNVHIQFFGGEPLLEFNLIKKITNYLKTHYKNRYSLSMFTNGTLINENVIEYLRTNRVHVTLSVDGPKEVNDTNRIFPNGSGAFGKTQASLNKLDRRNTKIRMTITPNNVAYLFDSIMYFYELGYHDIQEEVDRFITWPMESINRLISEYKKLGLFLVDKYRDSSFHWKNYEQRVFPFLSSKNTRRGRCGSSEGMCSMDTNGDLYPCQKFIVRKTLKIGDIYNGFNDEQRNIVSSYRLPNYLKETRKCKSCQYVGNCFAGCIADNILQDTDQVQDCVFRKLHREFRASIFSNLEDMGVIQELSQIVDVDDCGGETGGCGGERGCGGEGGGGDGCGGENCSYM